MRSAGVLLALAGALALQTTLAGLTVGAASVVNLVLVVVVYSALAFGPGIGLMAGTAGGLAQDALAGGIVGIGGFAKTLVGFVVGILGTQFIVSQTLARLVIFVGATMLHEWCFQALYALAGTREFRMQYPAALTQAAVNGVIGIIVFQIAEAGPGLVQRRRASRTTFSRRRY